MSKEITFFGITVTLLLIIALPFFVDISALRDWIISSGPLGPLILILLKISTIVLAPLSGGPLYPIAGFLFGFWPAFFFMAIGDFIGYSAAFWISRLLGQKAVQQMIKENESSILAKISTKVESAKGLFTACIIFFSVPELISYATGLSKIRYRTFISILWPLMLIITSLLVSFGAYIELFKEFVRTLAF